MFNTQEFGSEKNNYCFTFYNYPTLFFGGMAVFPPEMGKKVFLRAQRSNCD